MIAENSSTMLQQYIDDVNAAKTKWEEAKNCFENASDPELIDIAIYEEQAAMRRYLRTLKQIKEYTRCSEASR
ncbi:MAG: DUF2508 family protein [Christensenellales bacterium]